MSAVRSLAPAFLGLAALLALSLVTPTPVEAQDQFVVGALGGIGGAKDDPFEERAAQLLFGYERGVRDRVVFRLGRIDLEADDAFEVEGDLTWLTVTSEYRLPEEAYISGLFLGVGIYEQATAFGDDQSWGVTLGVDGEFTLTEHWSLLIEVSGHWAAEIDPEPFFTTALGGFTYSF